MASATTRRGLSSFTEITSPTRIPLKLTLPPLRRPAAGPSNTMRNGLRALVVWRDWNHSTKPNAAAITASVNDPIRTKFARVSINQLPYQASEFSTLNQGRRLSPSFGHDLFRKPVSILRQRGRPGRDHALPHDSAGPLAVEISPQPRVLRGLHVGHRSCCNDFPVPQNGDAVTSGIKAIQIMGYHENGQPQSTLQGPDQLVKVPGPDRIEAR